MKLMTQSVNVKLKQYYYWEGLGSQLLSLISWCDLVQIISIEENLTIESSEKINDCFTKLYGPLTTRAIRNTMKYMNASLKNKYIGEDFQEFIDKKKL